VGVQIIFSFPLWDLDSCLLLGNNICACDAVKKHVLALEVDLVTFHKALLPLVKQFVLEDT
jgi:hypothetical protein